MSERLRSAMSCSRRVSREPTIRIDAVFVEDGHRKADIPMALSNQANSRRSRNGSGKFSSRTRETGCSAQETAWQKTRSRRRWSVQRRKKPPRLEAAESSLKNLGSQFRELRHKVVMKVTN